MRTFLSIFAILFFGASFAQKNSDKPHSLGTIYPSEWTTYKDALSGIPSLPGRFEIIRDDVTVVIDYAHTHVAFYNVMKELSQLNSLDKLQKMEKKIMDVLLTHCFR